jgi:hypothetical protein
MLWQANAWLAAALGGRSVQQREGICMNYPNFHELIIYEIMAERERRLQQQARYARIQPPIDVRPHWIWLGLAVGLGLAGL